MLDKIFRFARITGILLALCAASSLPAAAAPGDPAAFAQAIYGLKNLWGDVTADVAARQKYLAPSLADLIAKNDSLGGESQIDYDPLADGQDFDISELKFTVASSDASKASVRVDFRNFGEPQTLTLELEVDGGAWHLANIRYDDERSLIDDLEYMNEGD